MSENVRTTCPPLPTRCRCPGVSELVPSWHIVPGICFESLAMQVARDYGVPGDVVARADQLLKELRRRKGQQQQLGAAKTSSHLPGALLPGDEGDRTADDDAASTEQGQEAEAGPAGAAADEADGEPAVRAKTLQDAVDVLRQLLLHLAEEGGSLPEDGEVPLPSAAPEVHVLKPEQKPPSSHLQQSVVYVVRWETAEGGKPVVCRRVERTSLISVRRPCSKPPGRVCLRLA